MSSRALRRLREEKERSGQQQPTIDEEDDDDGNAASDDDEGSDYSDDSDARGGGGKNAAFLLMMDDSDGSSSEEEEEESDDGGGGDDVGDSEGEKDGDEEKEEDGADTGNEDGGGDDDEEEEEEEDIDAIISEFHETANAAAAAAASTASPSGTSAAHAAASATPGGASSSSSSSSALDAAAVLTGLDPRDLDLERSMGALLGGGGGGGGMMADQQLRQQQQQQQRFQRGRNQRGIRAGGLGRGPTPVRKFAFGRPNELWGRPPSYVGGGLGMDVATAVELRGRGKGDGAGDGGGGGGDQRSVPWPYSDGGTTAQDPPPSSGTDATTNSTDSNPYSTARWHTYTRSDSYANQCVEYEAVAGSGDVNSVALFVADNLYHAESALQLSSVMFHTNHREQAMELLRRVLWVYEFAAPGSFLPGGGRDGAVGAGGGVGGACLMDQGQEENGGYFSALFRLMRTSCMVGCVGTSLAVSRYLLSLDPLRDPMGVLLAMDYFALASMKDEHARFVVDLVESKTIQIHHRDEHKTYRCDLVDLPNWSFDYALALYRLRDSDEDEGGEEPTSTCTVERADAALRSALFKFPSALELLLDKNGVDTRGRSFQVDWPVVLAYFRKVSARVGIPRNGDGTDADSLQRRAATVAAGAHTVQIFVQRSHKLWAGDDVIRWLHNTCASIVTDASSGKEGDVVDSPPPFQPALMRYMRCDPADYEDSFTTLPADANPLDPALVAPAMALDPNRRRMLRRGPRGGGGGRNDNEDWQRMIMEQLGRAPGGEMAMIDPDLPLAEVFWRSLMPWAHVEGVPPPNR